MFTETIIALSSPPMHGGIRGIVRLSGKHAWQLAIGVSDNAAPRIGWQSNIYFQIDTLKVPGNLLLFKAPRSFTGEDIAELHLPNSPPLLHELVEQILKAAGTEARLAQPGEFSARAFFNGKVDLTQAEGIAATINATQQTQLRAAASLRGGALQKATAQLSERVAHLLALVEAGIDFADEEDIRFVDEERLGKMITQIAATIGEELQTSVRIERLASPPTIVLVGKPNVGKSSLINALCGTSRSIVSPIAGTTRDILAATLHTAEGEIRLLDVPGEEMPTDELRQKMMAARDAAILDADLVVEVLDASNTPAPAITNDPRHLYVCNKADLLSEAQKTEWETGNNPHAITGALVSAKTGYQMAELREALGKLATQREHAGGERLVLNQRHVHLLTAAKETLHRAADLTTQGSAATHPELIAAELRESLNLLGEITGAISPDEILGRIFSQFCIGK